jgi:hypothetical protein
MPNAVIQAARRASLDEIKTNLLDTGSLRLFQNDIAISDETVVGDLDIATFGGYANAAIALWNAPYTEPGGLAAVNTPNTFFAASGVAPANLIYGWFYLAAGGALYAAGNFDAPISMGVVGNAISLVIELRSDGSIRSVVI